MALCAWLRARSSPVLTGEDLALGAWQRLEALPRPALTARADLPLACLIAIAVCAFHRRRERRFTAVGQWIRRAVQADLARLARPVGPAGRPVPAPDEKTIRVVLDRLDPGHWPVPCSGRAEQSPALGGPPAASVRRYRARRAAPAGEIAGPRPVKAVAVDGKTSRGARRADGTRSIFSASPTRRRLLDHLRGRCQAQRDQLLHRAPGTPGPGRRRGDLRCSSIRCGRTWTGWSRKRNAHYHRGGEEQPAAAARPDQGPALAAGAGRSTTRETGHGRTETRTLKAAHVSRWTSARPPGHQDHPPAQGHRHGRTTRETVYAVTSLISAHVTAADLARLVREHWSVEAHTT